MAYNDIFFQIRKLEFLFRIFQRRAGMSEPMLFCAYGFVSPCFIQIIIMQHGSLCQTCTVYIHMQPAGYIIGAERHSGAVVKQIGYFVIGIFFQFLNGRIFSERNKGLPEFFPVPISFIMHLFYFFFLCLIVIYFIFY